MQRFAVVFDLTLQHVHFSCVVLVSDLVLQRYFTLDSPDVQLELRDRLVLDQPQLDQLDRVVRQLGPLLFSEVQSQALVPVLERFR